MTVAKTDYHEAQVTDRIFANTAPDGAQDGCYVALWATSPANAPDTANELTGDGYSPIQVTASGWSTTANTANPREYDNDAEINYGVLDSASQKTVTGVVLYDGADTSTANALYYGDLSTSKTVDAGDEFKINAGDLTIGED